VLNLMAASALILVGGRSARMGRPKATLPFGAVSMLERIIAELHRGFGDLIIVAAPAADEAFKVEDLIDRCEPADGGEVVRLIRDEHRWGGPAQALACGLAAARNEIVFACSSDLPLLTVEVARAICAMVGDHDAAVPEIGGRLQPLCAAYKRRCATAIAADEAAGERRLSELVARLDLRRIGEAEMRAVDPELRCCLNVNTPADYARALAGIPRSE
jgi:molybdopterin-guanine dinucleotide biosynthesis protein A